jgi:ABC-type antimicrobial peptide transport system permease subunit
MALGASRGNVVNLVLKEAMALALLGLGLGLIGAYFVGRAMHSTLFGVAAIDFSAIAVVALVLLSTACWPVGCRLAALPASNPCKRCVGSKTNLNEGK